MGAEKSTETLRKYVDRWLDESVDFGGEWISRAKVYEWFQRQGYPTRAADLWLLGYERTHTKEALV